MTWVGLCGQECPRREIEFLVQSLVLFVVVVVSLYNLTVAEDRPQCGETVWASLLSACVGICTPGPVISWQRRRQQDDELDAACREALSHHAPQ